MPVKRSNESDLFQKKLDNKTVLSAVINVVPYLHNAGRQISVAVVSTKNNPRYPAWQCWDYSS